MVTTQYKHQIVHCQNKRKVNRMEKLNISPALFDTSSTPMSSTEFQRMLYTWFEEKGLVADLRSYLRVLMINKLRNTAVGKLDHQNKANFSLPKQALCLVIAEHLLREGCHYTLSIFSTEVPGVANHLPFSLFEAHCQKESEVWRFDQDSVLNVLELVGISKNSDENLRIAGLYFRNYGSLLSCLINSKAVDKVDVIRVDDGENVEEYLGRVMSLMGAPSNVTDEVKKKIHETIVKERDKNDMNLQKQFRKAMEGLKGQLLAKDHQIKELIEEQVTRKKDNKKLKGILKETRKHLNQMIVQEKSTKMKEEQIKEELKEIQRLRESFKHKEEPCLQKHCTEQCHRNTELAEDLQKQVLRLQDIDKNKTIEIERLTSRINSLMKDLQNSQMKIEFLNSCLIRCNQLNVPPEELHYSTDDTSDNITEEILKEVRSKLVNLERESDELDVRFKKLKMK